MIFTIAPGFFLNTIPPLRSRMEDLEDKMILYYMPLLMASLISILTFSKGENTSRVSKIGEFLALALGFAFVTFMLINKDTLSMNFGYTFLAVAFVCQYCTGNFRKAQNRKSIVTPRVSYVLLSLMWIFLIAAFYVELKGFNDFVISLGLEIERQRMGIWQLLWAIMLVLLGIIRFRHREIKRERLYFIDFLLTISFVIFILEYKYYYIDPMYKLSFGVYMLGSVVISAFCWVSEGS